MLIGIGQRLPDATDGALRATGKPFVSARRRDFVDDGLLSELRIHAPGEHQQALSGSQLASLYSPVDRLSQGSRSQCVEIITAR